MCELSWTMARLGAQHPDKHLALNNIYDFVAGMEHSSPRHRRAEFTHAYTAGYIETANWVWNESEAVGKQLFASDPEKIRSSARQHYVDIHEALCRVPMNARGQRGHCRQTTNGVECLEFLRYVQDAYTASVSGAREAVVLWCLMAKFRFGVVGDIIKVIARRIWDLRKYWLEDDVLLLHAPCESWDDAMHRYRFVMGAEESLSPPTAKKRSRNK